MRCNEPGCTGVHSTTRRIEELCPRAQEMRRASWNRYNFFVRDVRALERQRQRISRALLEVEEALSGSR